MLPSILISSLFLLPQLSYSIPFPFPTSPFNANIIETVDYAPIAVVVNETRILLENQEFLKASLLKRDVAWNQRTANDSEVQLPQVEETVVNEPKPKSSQWIGELLRSSWDTTFIKAASVLRKRQTYVNPKNVDDDCDERTVQRAVVSSPKAAATSDQGPVVVIVTETSTSVIVTTTFIPRPSAVSMPAADSSASSSSIRASIDLTPTASAVIINIPSVASTSTLIPDVTSTLTTIIPAVTPSPSASIVAPAPTSTSRSSSISIESTTPPAALPSVIPPVTIPIPAIPTVEINLGTLGIPRTGDGTFFEVGLGACGTTVQDSDFIVAVSHILYDAFPGATLDNPNTNPICGRQIKAKYNGNSVNVVVQDKCESCAEFDLDFSPSAFKGLASFDVGRLQGMTWQFV